MDSEWAMFGAFVTDAASMSYGLKVIDACQGGNQHQRWWRPSWWRRRPLGLGCPRGLLKQLVGSGWPEGRLLQWLWKQKLGLGRNSGRLWRRTFCGPRGGSGKMFGNLLISPNIDAVSLEEIWTVHYHLLWTVACLIHNLCGLNCFLLYLFVYNAISSIMQTSLFCSLKSIKNIIFMFNSTPNFIDFRIFQPLWSAWIKWSNDDCGTLIQSFVVAS